MRNNDNYPAFLVGVRCMTYNHHAYIEDAMNGFTMQQTTFPFVCAIIDDASTDGEPDVILRYMNDHFDLAPESGARQWETDEARFLYARHRQNPNCYFGIVLLKTNYYSQHKSKEHLITQWLSDVKYYALCEGDDYWIDPQKLQIQVDFLENHPDYSMCFHRAAVLDYIGINSYLRCFDIQNRDYTSDELFSQWIVPTNSMVYKRECMDYPIAHKENILNGDIFCVLACSHTGKVRGMSEYLSVYRIQEGGVTYDPAIQKDRTMRYPKHDECIRENFPQISKDVMDRVMGLHYYYRSQLQTDEKLRKEDYDKAKLYIPQILNEKRNQKMKLIIKKIVFSPYYLFFR